MNTMSMAQGCAEDLYRLSPQPLSIGLSAYELSKCAAARYAQIEDIEADINCACEYVAARHCRTALDTRDAWGRPTWRRYVAEAIRQGRLHATELSRLRREAACLDRLIQALDDGSIARRRVRSLEEG